MEKSKRVKHIVHNSSEKRKPTNITMETVCFIVFIIMSIILFYFHEPWYDEIQAWLLARDASLYDILFVLPHYEGHPPLWHLLLAIFAKNGVKMEIGMRIVTLAFSTGAAYLMIFRAPFKRIIRLILPFTYYFFYQYTITNRPYAIMMFSMLLAACLYKTRNEKPIRYIAALFLLCFSSAFGMVIAGSICLVWVIEIMSEKTKQHSWSSLGKDRRFYALLVILILAVGLSIMIFPADNAFASVRAKDFSRIKCLIYMFFLAPGDALCTDFGLGGRLQQYDYLITPSYTNIMNGVVSCIMLAALVVFSRKYKKTLLLVVPYICMGLFGALVYFYYHHIGLIWLFFVLFLWCCLDERKEADKNPAWMDKIEQNYPKLIKKVTSFLVGVCILVPLAWNIVASVNDINKDVWYAKSLAKFIKEYELDQYQVAAMWTYDITKEAAAKLGEGEGSDSSFDEEEIVVPTDLDNGNVTTKENEDDNETQRNAEEELKKMLAIKQLDPHDYEQYVRMCNFSDTVVYFNHNFIYNYNDGEDNNCYVNHETLTDEETYTELNRLGSMGYPEVILGSPEILGLMGLDANKYMYYQVYLFSCYRVNKFVSDYGRHFVYVREDIYKTRNDWPIVEQANITQ